MQILFFGLPPFKIHTSNGKNMVCSFIWMTIEMDKLFFRVDVGEQSISVSRNSEIMLLRPVFRFRIWSQVGLFMIGCSTASRASFASSKLVVFL